jgi:hypothetical protein
MISRNNHHTIQIPANFIKKYTTFNDLKGVSQQQQHYYAITLFQAMVAEPTGNKPLIENTKVDQLGAASQNE